MMTVLYHHPVTSNQLYNLLLTITPVAIFLGMTTIAASHPFIPTPNVAPIPQCIGYQIPVRRLIWHHMPAIWILAVLSLFALLYALPMDIKLHGPWQRFCHTYHPRLFYRFHLHFHTLQCIYCPNLDKTTNIEWCTHAVESYHHFCSIVYYLQYPGRKSW